MDDVASLGRGELSRRSLLRLGAVAASAVAVAACSGESGRTVAPPLGSTAAPSGGPARPVTTVTTAAPHVQKSGLPLDHTPYWPQRTIGEPQSIVDARASVFLITADERDAPLFLMSWIPNVDIDQVLLGEAIDPATALGGAWASGYWHGAYVKALTVASKPASVDAGRSPSVGDVAAVDEAGFLRLGVSARSSALIRSSGRSALLEAVDAALWRGPNAAPASSDSFVGLVEKFGAASGAFRALFEQPPPGAEPLDEYDVTCNVGLGCEFATERLNASSQLNTRFAQRLRNDAGLAGVRRRIDQVIADATSRGRSVWDATIATRSLDPADYRRVVDLYSARLEARWSVTLAAVEAVVQRDAALARRASFGAELLDLWDTATAYGRARSEPYRAPDFVST